MEIHRQQCQQCGSRDVRNILVRETGAPVTVYVRCLGCESLVARYKLSEYYHNGKGIESFLRSLGAAAGESGRDYLAKFNRIEKEAQQGYQEIRDELKARHEAALAKEAASADEATSTEEANSTEIEQGEPPQSST